MGKWGDIIALFLIVFLFTFIVLTTVDNHKRIEKIEQRIGMEIRK